MAQPSGVSATPCATQDRELAFSTTGLPATRQAGRDAREQRLHVDFDGCPRAVSGRVGDPSPTGRSRSPAPSGMAPRAAASEAESTGGQASGGSADDAYARPTPVGNRGVSCLQACRRHSVPRRPRFDGMVPAVWCPPGQWLLPAEFVGRGPAFRRPPRDDYWASIHLVGFAHLPLPPRTGLALFIWDLPLPRCGQCARPLPYEACDHCGLCCCQRCFPHLEDACRHEMQPF